MNIEQANNLDFEDLLSRLGFEPIKRLHGGNELWYSSPFRKEKEPSFHIRKGNTYNWVWHDFGSGEGTTLLEFICKYKNLNKKNALGYLDGLYPSYKSRGGQTYKDPKQSFLFPPQNSAEGVDFFSENDPDTRDLEFIKDSPLQSSLIFSYLEGRGIGREYANRVFRLLHYRNKNKPSQKPYFGFGVQNESGGWECRSASDDAKMLFKSALICRDISVIKGKEQGRGVNIFEGMVDYASLLVMLRTHRLKSDSIILHGLTMYGRCANYIRQHEYSHIHLFLDNNTAGQDTGQKFLDDFGNMVLNHSPKFLPYNDLNDALKDRFMPIFSPKPPSPQP